jgi:putative sigma-54 modulation protein
MTINMRALDFELTRPIRRHVESRVEIALAPVARWVRGIAARLEDVNADRGGVDKRCRLIVTLRRRGTVVTEATDVDLYAAVDTASSRLRRAALRAVKRPYARGRRAPRRPGALLAA